MTRQKRKWIGAVALAALASTVLAGNVVADPGADAPLNQYYAMKDEDPKGALALLEEAAKHYPDDLRIHSELAFGYLRAGDKVRALGALEAATAIAPDRADLWQQIGYVELDLDQPQKALEAFQKAHKIDPDDQQVVMQIGYLQQQLGDDQAAAEAFQTIAMSGDEDRAEQACAAYRNVRGSSVKLLPNPWFAEVYAAPEYRSHDDVAVLPIEGRVGVSYGSSSTVEAYVSLRGTIDTRSGKADLVPITYYDNAAFVAGGVRVQPFADVPVSLFAEAGAGYDIADQNRGRLRSDFRGGAVAYQQWNAEPPCAGGSRFPFRFIADVYGEAIYYSRYDNNVLFYARARPGMRMFETPAWGVDGYLLGAISSDLKNNKDDRFNEYGTGIALHAYDPFRWTARAEWVDVNRSQAEDYSNFRFRLEYQTRF